MKLITLNCNGIRSAKSKGLFEFIIKQKADILAFQEIKAEHSQMNPEFFEELGYIPFVFSAQKKGYSGTAIYSKVEPKSVVKGLEFPLCDDEGRWLQADFEHLSVISLYMPSGSSGE